MFDAFTGQGFGSSGFTSPLASDFLEQYKLNVLPSSDAGVLSGGPQTPTFNLPGQDNLDKRTLDLFEKTMTPEYREKLMQDKLRFSRAEMGQATADRMMNNMADQAGYGLEKEAGIIGNAASNISTIMAGTRLPSPAIQSGSPSIMMAGRQYFG